MLAAFAATALNAQDGGTPERIDVLADTVPAQEPADLKVCTDRQDAARISGEIVVCGRPEDNAQHRLITREEAESRFAQETMNRDAPPTPDPCGPNCGIFKGPPTAGGICGIGLNPCPPPPAYMVDFASLPKAPAGSDADRIARGLPPVGNDIGNGAGTDPASEKGPVNETETVSSSESASPAAAPSG